jgi:photosystem II stability/assembly factor-like uncharacterized protein/preprotein translocase subunit YajC
MRKWFFILVIVSLLTSAISSNSFGEDRWINIGPGSYANVAALAINPQAPDTLYAGTEVGGVCKSTNGGANWTTMNTGLTNTYALAINPQTPDTLYAGTAGGVFKSTNGGGNWTPMNLGLTHTTTVNTLAINPQTPETLYAGTHNYGVFKTTNGGGNWTAMNTGMNTSSYDTTIVINPQTPETLYAGLGVGVFTSAIGVFKSTDGGTNWTAMSNGLTDTRVNDLVINPQTPETLYAGTFAGVFKSTNGGANWTAMNTGLINTGVNTLVINPQTPETLYAGTDSYGVFKSTNGGANWTAMNTGLINTGVNTLVINPQTPETLYAGTDSYGVFKSTNGGENWTPMNTGLTDTTTVNTLAINPQTPETLYAGTDSYGVFKSTNGGENWTPMNTGLTDTTTVNTLAINPQTPETLYAGTDSYGVFKSTNGGTNWTATGLTSTYVDALAINPQTPETLYAGTQIYGVSKSTNGGANWGFIGSRTYFALAINPQTPETLYAGASGGVFKSTNGGVNWTAMDTGLTNTYVNALAINPQTPDTLYAGTAGGVFKTTDGGTNWTPMNNGLTNTGVRALAINPQTPDTLYAGTSGGGVFKIQQVTEYTLTVLKSGTGSGTVTSNPSGINCGSDCSESYNQGTIVTLTATPASGSTFTGWSGVCSGTGTCTVTMNAATSVTATFSLQVGSYTLTVVKSGTGSGTVTSSPSGIDCGSDCSESYDQGTSVTLTAAPAAGSTFGGWSGACSGTGTCAVTMNAAKSVTATFNLQAAGNTLTIFKTGTGTGTVTSSPAGINCGDDCSEVYTQGTKVTLTAKADVNSTFTGWSGGGCTGTKTCTVTVDSEITVTASFALKTPDISVSPGSLDFGSVKSGKKTTKTLKITNNGSGDLVITFSGLEGTEFSIQGSSSVTIKAKKSYSLKVLCTPTSGGLKTATLEIDSNDADTPTLEISLTAVLPATTPDISVAQTSLDFGSVKLGKKVTKTLKIGNNGTGDLMITLSGLEGTDFSIQGSSSVTIKAKKSYTLKVLFTPTSAELKTAILEITSNDPDTPTIDISLSGTGQ